MRRKKNIHKENVAESQAENRDYTRLGKLSHLTPGKMDQSNGPTSCRFATRIVVDFGANMYQANQSSVWLTLPKDQ
jgi:hypothetical protein